METSVHHIRPIIQGVSQKWEKNWCQGSKMKIKIFRLKENQNIKTSSQVRVSQNNLSKSRIEYTPLTIHLSKGNLHINLASLKKHPTSIRKRKTQNTHSLMATDLMEIQLMETALLTSLYILRKISNLKRKFYQRVPMIYLRSIVTATKKKQFLNHVQSWRCPKDLKT